MKNKRYKKCSRCKEEKDLCEFTKDSHLKDGLSSHCKQCAKDIHKLKIESGKAKEYYRKNKEKIDVYQKKWLSIGDNKDRISKIKKEWNEKHKDQIKEYGKKYYQENKKRINERNKKRRKLNIQENLALKLRQRLNKAITGNYKTGSAVSDLGCSIDEFKIYLEGRFYLDSETNEQMSWENYGKYGWHIDHINPLSSFDLTNREQFLEAVNYKNLQPLWMSDNLSKGGKKT